MKPVLGGVLCSLSSLSWPYAYGHRKHKTQCPSVRGNHLENTQWHVNEIEMSLWIPVKKSLLLNSSALIEEGEHHLQGRCPSEWPRRSSPLFIAREKRSKYKIICNGWHVTYVEWGEISWLKPHGFCSWGQMRGLPGTPYRDGDGNNVDGSWNWGMRRYQQQGVVKNITSGDPLCGLETVRPTGDKASRREMWEEMAQEVKWDVMSCPFSGLENVSAPTCRHNGCSFPASDCHFCVFLLLFLHFILNYFLVARVFSTFYSLK